MNQKTITLAGALCLMAAPCSFAHAQGIIVQNPSSYAQRTAEFVEQIANLKNQLTQQMDMLKSMTGSNGYGALLGSSVSQLESVLPADWQTVYADAMGGSSTLAGSASAVTSAFTGKVDGMGRVEALQYTLQQMQQKGGYDRAMTQRIYDDQMRQLSEISDLQGQIDGTDSVKDAADLQARIQTLQGELQAQTAKLSLMSMLQSAEDKLIAAQREEAVTRYALGADGEELPSLDVTGG